MKDLRVLFMGTPDFAVHILDHLVKANTTIVGVVTVPDKPSGRGQKVHSSAVKRYAVKQNLPVFQPANLKSEEFQNTLKNLNLDVSVVVAFRMLPEKVWNFPPLGTFNLHASLLPDYRGAAPINWAIINGETETGVTTFFLDKQIDTGNIIAQTKVAITPEDTAGSLHDKLMLSGAELVKKTLDHIAKNTVSSKPQNTTQPLKEAPKFTTDNTKVNWNNKTQVIYNFVRGLNPYPVAWATFYDGQKELRCKLFSVTPEVKPHDYTIGKVIKTKTELSVAVQDGFIHILEMQLPGKRKMQIKDILNGLHLTAEAAMR